jgi:hypothetical protein
VLEQGSTMLRLLLKSDTPGLSPLWEPVRHARELGASNSFSGSIGHFVCADGFGPVSAAEKNAGLQGAGRSACADLQPGECGGSGQDAKPDSAGEPADRQGWNELGFDRPIVWAEHATIGSFLAPGKTTVDLPAS